MSGIAIASESEKTLIFQIATLSGPRLWIPDCSDLFTNEINLSVAIDIDKTWQFSKSEITNSYKNLSTVKAA
jgi:hypothetical protein